MTNMILKRGLAMNEGNALDGAMNATLGGGTFAGVLLGGRWLINWLTGRHDRRQANLDAQELRAAAQWADIRAELRSANAELRSANAELRSANDDLARRIGGIEKQNRALWFSFNRVAGELTRIDPKNRALIDAHEALARAFPLDFTGLAGLAGAAIDASEENGHDD